MKKRNFDKKEIRKKQKIENVKENRTETLSICMDGDVGNCRFGHYEDPKRFSPTNRTNIVKIEILYFTFLMVETYFRFISFKHYNMKI